LRRFIRHFGFSYGTLARSSRRSPSRTGHVRAIGESCVRWSLRLCRTEATGARGGGGASASLGDVDCGCTGANA
jgi:hypothetical protein